MAERKLHVASDLTLPVEAITQTFIIFGKRGSGKSNTGVVLAEEMHRAGAPIIVLDPISAWWGLKASVDGQGVGLPVYVFGGPHQDLPLQPTAGELMARVAIEHRIPMVLDMKGWSGGERARFVTAFAEHLLDHNDRTPVHVFIEEADAFIPQRPYKGEERMLGAMDRLIRWGRQEGIGATAISQRSAKINKDVTTQAETLIAHRTTGPQDRDAIDAWIKYHAGGEQREQILATLATLPDGTAWVWSPEWLEILRQVHFRRRATFDSASTPKFGEKRVEPKALAQVDVDRLAKQLAATVQQAKAEDPKLLQARIRELERQMADSPKPSDTPQVVIERVEVPVLNGQVDQLEQAIGRLSLVGGELVSAGVHIGGIAKEIVGVADDLLGALRRVGQAPATVATVPRPQSRPAPPRSVPATSTSPPRVDGEPLERLGAAERAFMAALVQMPGGLSAKQLSLLTGYSAKSGHFANVLGRLRSVGLVERGQPITATEAGRTHPDLAGVEPLPMPGADLIAYWMGRLGKAERAMLEVFVERYPVHVDREELAERTGYSSGSGHFANVLGRLRTIGLIDGWRASQELVG